MKFYAFSHDVRPCPKCGVKIEKNKGCPHMKCEWCKFDFCWSCMNEEKNCLAKACCIPLCPRLPFSMCINFMITLLGIILAPLFLTLGPIFIALFLGIYEVPRKIITKSYGGRHICRSRRMNTKEKW